MLRLLVAIFRFAAQNRLPYGWVNFNYDSKCLCCFKTLISYKELLGFAILAKVFIDLLSTCIDKDAIVLPRSKGSHFTLIHSFAHAYNEIWREWKKRVSVCSGNEQKLDCCLFESIVFRFVMFKLNDIMVASSPKIPAKHSFAPLVLILIKSSFRCAVVLPFFPAPVIRFLCVYVCNLCRDANASIRIEWKFKIKNAWNAPKFYYWPDKITDSMNKV